MTTPPPAEPEPNDPPTAEQPPVDAPTATPSPTAGTPGPAGPPGYPPPYPSPYPSPYPPPYPPPYGRYPFTPQPREPWINPAKRAAVVTIAIVAAVVLLGAGLLIGAAVSGHDSRAHTGQPGFGPAMHMGRPGSIPGRMPNRLPDGRPGRGRQVPRYPGAGGPSASAVPSAPAPTASHS